MREWRYSLAAFPPDWISDAGAFLVPDLRKHGRGSLLRRCGELRESRQPLVGEPQARLVRLPNSKYTVRV
jgi:hypothetical protein